MKRWRAFQALCGHLRAGLLDRKPLDIDPRMPIELLIEFSSQHLVTPALAWCLKDAANNSADARAYFAAVLELNTTHNAGILDGLARVLAALNKAGIQPILLKGAAHLVEGIYPAPGIRIVGDIDLLVATDEAAAATAALHAIGFVTPPTPVSKTHHHLPMMHDHEARLTVEIHTRVEHRLPDLIAPYAWFRQNTRQLPFRGLRALLPDPTRIIAHNVIHGQLNHENEREGMIGLRQLLDFALIRARHGARIDWPELERRFARGGADEVLATYVAFAKKLLGQPAPRMKSRPRAAAMETLRRTADPAASRKKGKSKVVRRILRGADIRRESGHCWLVDLPTSIASGDNAASPIRSTLELLEGGKSLGPPHSAHDLIRQHGQGAFSHWQNALFFSTSDNSDPRSSGRRYSVVVRIPAEQTIISPASST